MCILHPMANSVSSEAMVASKRPQRSNLIPDLNPVTIVPCLSGLYSGPKKACTRLREFGPIFAKMAERQTRGDSPAAAENFNTLQAFSRGPVHVNINIILYGGQSPSIELHRFTASKETSRSRHYLFMPGQSCHMCIRHKGSFLCLDLSRARVPRWNKLIVPKVP